LQKQPSVTTSLPDQLGRAIMGLIRIILRTFLPKVRVSRPSVVFVPSPPPGLNGLSERAPLRPAGHRPPPEARRSTHIRIFDVHELRGRAWVIDGDTIDIGGTRIRLSGIDAPEMDHPCGKNAKWTLVNLCKGQEVRAVFDGDLSHDRTVASCYLPDGRDLAAEMVKAGMAIDWRKFSGGKYRGLEPDGIRKKLWRCDARQKGLMAPSLPD
jgi:micrococcal nuclease